MAEKMSTKKKWAIAGVVIAVIILMAVIVSAFGETTEEQKYYIGDTVTHKNVSITVTSVENTKSYGFHTTSYNFVVIYFDVTNNQNESISINPLYCELSMGETVFSYAGYDYGVFDIVPGGTLSLSIAYETVKTSTEADYVMKFGYSILNSKVIEINLQEKSE